MEIAYIMIGRRFKVKDKKERTINEALASFNLVKHPTFNWVRSTAEKNDKWPYYIIHSYGDEADFGVHYSSYDFCVGKLITNGGEPGKEVIEVELGELESILKEVKEDIKDAKILGGSYWA